MKKIKLFFTVLFVLLAMGISYAQSGEVTGNVTDAGTGDPIPYASVKIKGTMTGVATSAEGTYRIKVSNVEKPVLVISFIGYKTVEIPVDGRNFIDVALEVDTQTLSDVIVVAYGTQKREAVTGSVSTIGNEGLADAPVTSVDKMLSGKLAGVTISSTSGQPGAVSQIRIRGTSSINAGNSPLWVVDGIPILSGDISMMTNSSSALTMVNPSDIESITVLKDAAAAAAYGSRAANGVILVTTKSGQEGRAQFQASAKFGVNWLQSDSDFRMMNANELLSYQRDAIYNAGMDPDDPTSAYYRPMSLLSGKLYDPLKEFTRLGNLQEYQISARGGNSRAKFFSSLLYQKNEGVVYGVDYSKFQARLNASYELTKSLEAGVRVNVGYSDQSDVPMQSLYYANPIWAGETIMPWEQLKNEDGSWNVELPTNSYQNPRTTAELDEQWQKGYQFNGTFNLKWTPIKDLVLETKNSAEISFNDSRRYWHPDSQGNGGQDPTLQTEQLTVRQFTTSNTATYSHVFNGLHSFRAVVGQEAMRYHSNFYYASAPGVDPSMPYLGTADQTKTQVEQGITKETMLSFLGIADYNYDNRYFAQATFREDGSSLFGEDNKWGAFWSASASWNVSNEKFFKRAVKPVSLLKVRASYGVSGNNGIDSYKAYGLYSTAAYNGVTGYVPSQLENNKLSWERNKTMDFGVDFGLFDNRISGSVDYYNRKTVDMLLTKRIPQTTGFSTIFTNVGSMRNSGLELQLDGDIIRTDEMVWSVGANVAFNRTKVLDLGDDDFLADGSARRIVVGKSLRTFYLYDYYGVNPSNGEALWVTEDGSLSSDQSKARQHYCGSPEPKAVGGFNTTFQWKGLSFSAFFEFKTGNKVFIGNEWSYLCSDGSQMSMNQYACARNYWKKPGDTGCNPKPVAGNASNSNAGSDRYLEDGSYLRVKDVTLAYTLPSLWTNKIHVGSIRFYVSGLNLYCFNDVYFWDPEQGVTGLTAGQYPLTKSVVGGIELTF